MDNITLFGAGGHCYAVLDLIKSLETYNPTVILDDHPKESAILGVPIKKNEGNVIQTEAVCITIGQNIIRKKISETNLALYPTFVHKSVVQYNAVIGKGSVVLPGVVLDSSVEIGDFCIINLNATLAHNVKVGNFCHVAINAAITGGVVINEGAFIAASAVILPNITIGKWATVGAGAVVTKDVPDYAVVYGSPAKIMKYNNHEQ
ncbi:putative acetyltransferase [unidentified eubacterium SCB49]|nr:putative acetyltransferase [unidentified eubacterium SCB49]